MSRDITKLRNSLAAFEATVDADAIDLRLDFAELLLSEMQAKGWTQAKLAQAAGMRAEYVHRVIHSNQNVTCESIARLMHAMGVRAKIVKDVAAQSTNSDDVAFCTTDTTNGEEFIKEEVEISNDSSSEIYSDS